MANMTNILRFFLCTEDKMNGYQLDVDSFPDLIAAVAKQALRDVNPSTSAARRAEAEEFLSIHIPTWRTMWKPRPYTRHGTKVRAHEQN
jgi:hypothetical protein